MHVRYAPTRRCVIAAVAMTGIITLGVSTSVTPSLARPYQFHYWGMHRHVYPVARWHAPLRHAFAPRRLVAPIEHDTAEKTGGGVAGAGIASVYTGGRTASGERLDP